MLNVSAFFLHFYRDIEIRDGFDLLKSGPSLIHVEVS